MNCKPFIISIMCFVAVIANAQDAAFSFSKKYNGEKFLVAGCGWDRIAVADRNSGRLEWQHLLGQGEDCNDLELTSDGNILYSYTTGARLITPDQKVVWDYKVPKGEELYTATELTGGGYLLAMCGSPARIVELDKSGKEVKVIPFDTGIESVHSQFRQICPSGKGTYIVPLFHTGEVMELDGNGKELRRLKVGGNLFMAKVIHNGNWLVACGDGHMWAEIDPVKWEVVKKVSSEDIKGGAALLFVAEIHRYKNGNTLITNWNGHSQDKSQPKMFEVDPENNVVWILPETPGAIANLSAVNILP